MKLTFFGAVGGEVTGSSTLVETDRARVLVDFGLIQGGAGADEANRRLPPIDPEHLDAVLLTHAHLDHSGRLPLLWKHGFTPPIYTTQPSVKLAKILLADSANLQLQDAMRESQRNARRGLPAVEPLYTPDDLGPAETSLRGVAYGAPVEVAPGVTARWTEAGHILGSASIELTARTEQGTRVVVFSGDIGPRGVPLLRDFEPPVTSGVTPDAVVLESTYGDRDHRGMDATMDELADILREAVWAKEKVLLPAFALGRTQVILHAIGELAQSGRVPRFPVYIDSPLASKATAAYREFWRTLDDGAHAARKGTGDPLGAPDVVSVETGDESRALNTRRGAMVVIAGSGMCTGGRIMHHLRHNLYKPDVRVVITGFQSQGTLGRRLVDKAPMVRIFGEEVIVRAKVYTLGGFSAHAGQSDLVRWAGTYASKGASKDASKGGAGPLFVLNHGEDPQRAALRAKLEEGLGARVLTPVSGAVVRV